MKALVATSLAAALLGNLSPVPTGPWCTATLPGEPGMVDRIAPDRLGVVSFANSCKPEVQADFNHGVALLHSFWLDEAERTFKQVAAADPDCAMADWGIAMTEFNEVNGGPTPGGVVWAKLALEAADTAREKTAREAEYLQALHRVFDGYTEQNSEAHAVAYTEAMNVLARRYPTDLEAQVFYALALIHSTPRGDVTLVNFKKAVAVLYPLFRRHPEHPGIAHYLIHAADNPRMARQGLEAARHYASIAPAAPHALHMPSHIFARLGLWEEDIRSNLASKAAAERAVAHVGAENRLHAIEFLEYAYLQTGQFNEARAMVVEGATVPRSDVDPRYPTYYDGVEARYPVLYAIETRDWALAANLKPIEGANWLSQGQTLLANAIAACHLRDAQSAQAVAERVEWLTASVPEPRTGSPRASLADEIRAWARFAQGDLKGAVALLRPVADRQAIAGKGEVELPAREMIADMFLQSGESQNALTEYQASLATDPNRFNALVGAAQAAERLGHRQLAASYYEKLLQTRACANGNAREILRHARAEVQGVNERHER